MLPNGQTGPILYIQPLTGEGMEKALYGGLLGGADMHYLLGMVALIIIYISRMANIKRGLLRKLNNTTKKMDFLYRIPSHRPPTN